MSTSVPQYSARQRSEPPRHPPPCPAGRRPLLPHPTPRTPVALSHVAHAPHPHSKAREVVARKQHRPSVHVAMLTGGCCTIPPTLSAPVTTTGASCVSSPLCPHRVPLRKRAPLHSSLSPFRYPLPSPPALAHVVAPHAPPAAAVVRKSRSSPSPTRPDPPRPLDPRIGSCRATCRASSACGVGQAHGETNRAADKGKRSADHYLGVGDGMNREGQSARRQTRRPGASRRYERR